MQDQERVVSDLRTTLSLLIETYPPSAYGDNPQIRATNVALIGGVLNDANLGFTLISNLKEITRNKTNQAKQRDKFWNLFSNYITAQGWESQYVDQYFEKYPISGKLPAQISVPYLSTRLASESTPPESQVLSEMFLALNIDPEARFAVGVASNPERPSDLLWNAYERNRQAFWIAGKIIVPSITETWLSEKGSQARQFLDNPFVKATDTVFDSLAPELLEDLNKALEFLEGNTALIWTLGAVGAAALGILAISKLT